MFRPNHGYARRSAFTLIELLVVIAIIGILAAMLFPVFARARESARKTQCLANVKNIAMSIQIYLTDYDRFPPGIHDAEYQDYMKTHKTSCSPRDYYGDPYLRWPVILDEYVKSREVWKCPSARNPSGANWIVPAATDGIWWHVLRDNDSAWGNRNCSGGGPCSGGWPSSWGGTITDSIHQQECSGPSKGGFEMSVGTSGWVMRDVSTSSISDPTYVIVTGDLSSAGQGDIQTISGMLYGYCGLGTDGSISDPTSPCGREDTPPVNDPYKWNSDWTYRAQSTPHMGGLNLGFADGHAKWWPQQSAIATSPICEAELTPERKFRGLCPPPGDF
jgi:prepilin-type N-terminal cleavage/methylation domain-containing protein/prepilin-type processing-associated H-X9-DG protein